MYRVPISRVFLMILQKDRVDLIANNISTKFFVDTNQLEDLILT